MTKIIRKRSNQSLTGICLQLTYGSIGLLSISQSLQGQQNLFNVPSATVTRKEEVFLQEQINFGKFGESNLTVDYGLGNNWEIGLNIYKVNLYPGNIVPAKGESNEDAILVNIQKLLEPFPSFAFEIGTQNGISANNGNQKVDYLNFTWGIGRWSPDDRRFKGSLLLGTYYGNTAFLGPGNEFGWMAGIEYPTWNENVSFVADFISGNNSSSVSVIGGQWTFSRRLGWQISLGAQLPTYGSGNDYGAVFELTKFPPSFAKQLGLSAE